MPLKIKVKAPGGDGQPNGAAASPPPPQSATEPTPKAPGFKLKLGASSKEPTPSREQQSSASAGNKKKIVKPKDTATKPTGKKRQAEEDISPAAKRLNGDEAPERKSSFKLKGPKTKENKVEEQDELAQPAVPSAPAPASAKLNLKKRPPAPPKRVTINVKKEPPPRPKAVGYDSEDSDVERDPMIEQAFILRMTPGEDCDLVRKAIEEKKIGLPTSEDGTDVRICFLDKDHRRGMVTIQRDRKYAAVLVDLPCVIESMKSWDKKGWWKAVDICQMLLVLGRCKDEEEARNMPLPHDVDPTTMKYAHGIAPPFHNVRKRRFRKRVVHRQTEAIEDEVERLLKDDEEAILAEGEVQAEMVDLRAPTVNDQIKDEFEAEPEAEYDDEADAPGEEYEEEQEEEDDVHVNLEEDMANAFDSDDDAPPAASVPAATAADTEPPTTTTNSPQPVPMNAADAAQNPILTRATSIPNNNANILNSDLVETPTASTPAAASPAAAASPEDNESDISYSSDSDDSDGPDELDEEQQAANLQRAQQEAEVADLREEVAEARRVWREQTNRMLIQRKRQLWTGLREQLRVKCVSFGLPFPEEEEDEDAGPAGGS
ncbi:hypothetical protein MBLNU230_g5278t1 [Neophaeotheca triangularis]